MTFLDPLKVFRVKGPCVLQRESGQVWARGGQYVYVDFDDPEVRRLMHGQESRIRSLTREEKNHSAARSPIHPGRVARPVGYQIPRDRFVRLDQADVVTKAPHEGAGILFPDECEEDEG